MSREIKFRAWEEKRKKWHFFSGIFGKRPYIEHSTFVQYESSPEYPELIVEQFTGLKDKNGVEIYEGDIVNAIQVGVRLGNVVEIRYQRTVSMIAFLAFVPGYGQVGFHAESSEVIGNIHENPELIR